jgi:cytochrome P450
MATDEQLQDLSFNPFDAAQTRTSWDKLARLRRECPVSEQFEGFFYTAKYDDTQAAFRDNERFWLGEAGMRKPGAVVPFEERFLGEIDPPDHVRLRRLIGRHFTPNKSVAAEPFARQYIRAKLEAIAAKGGAELVRDFSTTVPIVITAHVLGLPTEDFDEVVRDMLDADNSQRLLEGDVSVLDAFPRMSALVDAAIAQRLAASEPPDDAITSMLYAGTDEDRISTRQVRTLAVNLLSGSSSTTSLFDNLFYRLLTDPGFDAALRADHTLIAKAVEESLRLEPPVLFLFRTARHDTALSGTPIAQGERVCMGIGSANRDEERYHDAEQFRLDRQGEPDHLTFGSGPHLCIGMHLARMEARIAVEEFFDLFPPDGVALADGYQFRFPADDFLRYGPDRLDIVVRQTTR